VVGVGPRGPGGGVGGTGDTSQQLWAEALSRPGV
jgi:hypothetical protein